MQTVPLHPLSPIGNREHAMTLIRTATGLPEIAAHCLALTLDAVSEAVLRAAGIPAPDARPILAALWQLPERLTDTPTLPPRPQPAPGGPRYLRDLGQRVHVIRRARRLTLTGLHHRTGIAVPVLRDLEAGAAWPTLPLLLAVAEALAVPLPLLVDPQATPLRILRLLAAQAA